MIVKGHENAVLGYGAGPRFTQEQVLPFAVVKVWLTFAVAPRRPSSRLN